MIELVIEEEKQQNIELIIYEEPKILSLNGKILGKCELMEEALKQSDISWHNVIIKSASAFRHIEGVLNKCDEIYPQKNEMFRVFLQHIGNIKVVIFGQDPYPQTTNNGKPKAMGLAFSIRENDHDIPGSLKNIYKEIMTNDPTFIIPNNGYLKKWEDQGVFLLNISLSVIPGNPGSHGKLWIEFIKNVIKEITEKNRNVIFVLWGSASQSMENFISNGIILTASHPSPLSAHRGFFGCNHFNLINQHLNKLGEKEINWNL